MTDPTDREITLRAFTVEHTTIPISEAVFRQAVIDERLDHELDARLSDMDGVTVIVDPDGIAIDPYYVVETTLIKLIGPILDVIPADELEQYIARRRAMS